MKHMKHEQDPIPTFEEYLMVQNARQYSAPTKQALARPPARDLKEKKDSQVKSRDATLSVRQ